VVVLLVAGALWVAKHPVVTSNPVVEADPRVVVVAVRPPRKHKGQVRVAYHLISSAILHVSFVESA
jgi:hypothetical protein